MVVEIINNNHKQEEINLSVLEEIHMVDNLFTKDQVNQDKTIKE